MRTAPGLVLEGKYRLVSELGEGGMGMVWRAEDLRLDAPVAVKLMHAQAASSAGARARFVREAKAAANLRSPHVVQVLDFGFDEAVQAPYLVMELLEGESLQARLARTGPLSPLEVSKVVTHVARALLRAHEANIVHRDLKPSNIFLVQNADSALAKVLDFGIAKWATQPLGGLTTQTGTFLGTPFYMGLEQIECSKNIDFRSDLWSLAVIAVECMTGQLPFSAEHLPALALQISQNRPLLPSRLGPVPEGFDAWFTQATASQPADRFASAADQAQALRALCEGEPRRPATVIEVPRASLGRTPSPSFGPVSRTPTFGDHLARSPSRRGRWLVAAAAPPLVVAAGWLALRQTSTPERAALHEVAGATAATAESKPTTAGTLPTSDEAAPRSPSAGISVQPAPSAPRVAVASEEASPSPSSATRSDPASGGSPPSAVEHSGGRGKGGVVAAEVPRTPAVARGGAAKPISVAKPPSSKPAVKPKGHPATPPKSPEPNEPPARVAPANEDDAYAQPF